MSKLNGRKQVEIKLGDLLDRNLPIYDLETRLWHTINVDDIVSGSVSLNVDNNLSGQTINGNIYITGATTSSFFTGSFIGDGSGLYMQPTDS